MKNKRGFTLIELLAVIVILAVIALIATPIIMNVINDAKKGAAKDSMYSYVKAVELSAAKDLRAEADLLSGTYTTKGGDLYTGSTKVLGVDMKGTKPEDSYGSVTLVKGRVTTAELKFDGNIITYDGDKANDSAGGSTPTPVPTGPNAVYAYNFDIYNSLENGSLSITPINQFTMNPGGVVVYNGSAGSTDTIIVPSEIGGQTVTTIDVQSFKNVVGNIVLPNTVITIETYTFREQSAMTQIVLPPSLTHLYNWIFSGATSLKSIKFTGTTVPAIENGTGGTFRDLTLSDKVIYVPNSAVNAYKEAWTTSLPSDIEIRGY